MTRTRTLLAAVAILGLSGPALGEELLSPSAFRSYAEGHTLHFEHDGQPFGAESFHSGNRTVWQYSDGTCDDGQWRAYGAQVCFSYESSPASLCWRMLRDEAGIYAELVGDSPDAGMILRVVRRERYPLLCSNGPEV